MKLETIGCGFTVCKLKDISGVDFSREFCFLGKTDEEISLVCKTEAVPQNTIAREDGWRAFRIAGMLDFSLIGILSRITKVLASNQIVVFAISTSTPSFLARRHLKKFSATCSKTAYERTSSSFS